MINNKKLALALALVLILTAVSVIKTDCLFLATSTAFSSQAKNSPINMEADSISYDADKGIIEAIGNVKTTQDSSIITCAKAEYNVKTKEGYMVGGVNAKMEDSTLIADEVHSYDNNNRISATGNVVITKGENRLTGPKVDYHPANQYVLVPNSGKIENKDAVMTAAKLEAFLGEERAIGTGGVHIVGHTRKIDAVADKADYYGLPKEESKIILTGNARVIDGENVLTGQVLTVRLQERTTEAQGGRPTLIINPESK